jgi:hypothetical protein
MIVDLQGVGNILTDPQIHCMDRKRFGGGNLGYRGMLMFFNTHQCNDHCKSLGLLNPRTQGKLPAMFEIVKDPEAGVTKKSYEKVHKLCDLCRKPFETTYGHYTSQRSQGFELWCKDCTQKRNDSFKSKNCSWCSKSFKSSAYWFLMKKTDFPDKCSGCRLLNREKMRAALETSEPKKSSGKPVPEQYKIAVVEAKGAKGAKPKAPKKKAAEA